MFSFRHNEAINRAIYFYVREIRIDLDRICSVQGKERKKTAYYAEAPVLLSIRRDQRSSTFGRKNSPLLDLAQSKKHASSFRFPCMHSHACSTYARTHVCRCMCARLHEESHGGMRSGEPIIPARHATSTRTPSDHCALFSGEALPLIAHCIPLLLSAG